MNMLNKTTLILVLLFFIGDLAIAQVPMGVNYQAVIRESSGEVIENRTVNLRFTILRTATNTIIYRETQMHTTNEFGLVNAVIGKGNPVTGLFQDVNWENGGLKLRVELDGDGGTFFEIFGESEFQSTPYALAAETAVNISNTARITPNQLLSGGASNGQILRWNGSSWVAANETAQPIVTRPRLTGNGTTANPLDIASMGAAAGQVLKWDGNSWAPANESTGATYTAGIGIQIENNVINARAGESLWNALQIRGREVSSATPLEGQVLSYTGSFWAPTTFNNTLQLPYDGTHNDQFQSAVRVTNTLGVGINARGNVGLRASYTGSGMGFALEIQNGGIKAIGSNRPAFQVSGSGEIIINHPLTNNTPNALLYVTQINPNPDMDGPLAVPFSITYRFGQQQWVILSDPNITLNYNVFVVNQ